MASRVEFSVSATPIYTATNAEMNDTDVIAKDVGKTVAGSGSVTVTWGSTTGFTAGVPTYVDGNGGTITTTSAKFLYIRHTGYRLNGTALGIVSTDNLSVQIGAVVITQLDPGEATVLVFGTNAQSQTYALVSAGDSIAVEYFWTA